MKEPYLHDACLHGDLLEGGGEEAGLPAAHRTHHHGEAAWLAPQVDILHAVTLMSMI